MQVGIIGSGAAGLSAALAALAFGAEVTLLTDRRLGASNSVMAQGGLHLPPSLESEASMRSDMERSAQVPLDPKLLIRFISEILPTVEELEDWGLRLDRDGRGELQLRIAGGMSEPRIVTSGDRIGAPLMKVLTRRIRDSDLILVENTPVLSVERVDNMIQIATEDQMFAVRAVVCATGGVAWAEAQARGIPTSNPANQNRHLFRSLEQGGALELYRPNDYQFQPFGQVSSLRDGIGKLIPESVVAHGVRILDRNGDEVVDPMAGRLTITAAMEKARSQGLAIAGPGGQSGFELTLSDIGDEDLAKHFPALERRLKQSGEHGAPVLVTPFLHYQLGGFQIGTECETAVPGLFLAGEMTGGIHGRNRLMGNGLTDSLVHGRRAGKSAALFAQRS